MSDAARIAALERRVADLSRKAVSGLGVSTVAGSTNFRTTQLGFAAELTSGWSSTTGYSFKRRKLDTTTSPISLVNPGVQPTGDKAYEISGDTSLTAGTEVWLEPSPDGVGYLFVHGEASSPDCLGPAAGWQTTDCLTFTVPAAGQGRCANVAAQTIPAAWSATELAWVGQYELLTDTGSWDALYDWPGGACCPRLRLRNLGGSGAGSGTGTGEEVSMRYVGCDPDTGGLEFASADPLLCGGTATAGTCGDNTFRVVVTCRPCPTVGVACCPGVDLPSQLCLTITSVFGDAVPDWSCAVGSHGGPNRSFLLTASPFITGWTGTGIVPLFNGVDCTPGPFDTVTFNVYCALQADGSYKFVVTIARGDSAGDVTWYTSELEPASTVVSCGPPFSLTADAAVSGTVNQNVFLSVTTVPPAGCGASVPPPPPPPPGTGACGGELDAHPDLTLNLSGGTLGGGPYTLVWNATDGAWEAAINGGLFQVHFTVFPGGTVQFYWGYRAANGTVWSGGFDSFSCGPFNGSFDGGGTGLFDTGTVTV